MIFFACALAAEAVELRDHEGYRFIGPAFEELVERASAKPARIQTELLGLTASGAPLWAFHVVPLGPVRRKVLVFAGIHALEWISTEVALDFLQELIDVPLDDVAVTVIPVLNPDGRARVEHDLTEGHNRYRRGNWNGVDLNRDFGVNTEARAVWKAVIPGYYAHSDTPLSQEETRAIDALLERERYDRMASLHAFGGYFYHPWSGRFTRPGDWGRFVELGRAMERTQRAHAYRTRQLSHWGFYFRAQGSELDHAYGRYGTLAYLIELTRSGFDPLHPRRSFETYFRWYNPQRRERHVRKGVAALRALVSYDPPGSDDAAASP